MCEKAVEKGLYNLIFVPDWFAMQGQVKVWYNHNYYCDDDELVKWNDGYQNHKAQKSKIKEELMLLAWHPSRWWDWCIPEDEKKETEKLWA